METGLLRGHVERHSQLFFSGAPVLILAQVHMTFRCKLLPGLFGYRLLICFKYLLEDLIVPILEQLSILGGHAHVVQLFLSAWNHGLYMVLDKCFGTSCWEISPALAAIRFCYVDSITRPTRPEQAPTVSKDGEKPRLGLGIAVGAGPVALSETMIELHVRHLGYCLPGWLISIVIATKNLRRDVLVFCHDCLASPYIGLSCELLYNIFFDGPF